MADDISRREAARLIAGTAATVLWSGSVLAQDKISMITRAIPSSGEKLPVTGLGTYQSFDVGSSAADRQAVEEVLRLFVQRGGRLIDSSPMYGRSEEVIGELAAKTGVQKDLFLATKVWTSGKEAGVASMERSFTRMQTKRMALMQVHNLVDVQTHLATLRDWKEQGRVRYIGITHYTAGSHGEVARVLEREKVDFVQINYSITEREADQRVLRVAQDRGVAVIANRPFGGGGMFGRVRGKPLPDFATEFDCTSWAQFFLKWIVAHPAITCAIPATSKAGHLADNMQAAVGRLPDAKMRERMVQAVAAL
ncbi:MAG TPA: aldo/keto reductase [Chthoniobacterales bacterium]|jgi:diketogulonate reductase-like aldo/keto reductase